MTLSSNPHQPLTQLMTITEFAILLFKSPPDFTDPTLQSLFHKLSAWQSECSGFPLRFFTNPEKLLEVYLVTGWTSVAAHEAWIRGDRNQELLRVFEPYVDIPRVRMVHVDVDFEAIPQDAGCTGSVVVVERYAGARSFEGKNSDGCAWELVGRDLALDDRDAFRFIGVIEGVEGDVGGGPAEQWVLRREKL